MCWSDADGNGCVGEGRRREEGRKGRREKDCKVTVNGLLSC